MKKRKSDLLREVERNLLWEHLNQKFCDMELAYLRWKNKQNVRELERRGML